MNANHAFLPFSSYAPAFLAGHRFEHGPEGALPAPDQRLFAAPDGPAGGGGAGNGRTEPNADGTEGGEIRDESGFGAGAGVEASAAGADQGTSRGTDITEGGTDAGGTDFGANMGTPEDTGGIDVRSLAGGNTGTAVAGDSIPTDPSGNANADEDPAADSQ